jgi:hypothetical protein
MYADIILYSVMILIKVAFDLINGIALDNENYRLGCKLIGPNPDRKPPKDCNAHIKIIFTKDYNERMT